MTDFKYSKNYLTDLIKMKGSRIYNLLKEIYISFPIELICFIGELKVTLDILPVI